MPGCCLEMRNSYVCLVYVLGYIGMDKEQACSYLGMA